MARVFLGALSALALSALALSGCDPVVLPVVGTPCADFSECPDRATAACIATWPEGYCTEVDCSAGSCPDGARCAEGLSFPGVSISRFCLATCTRTPDCRSGYLCVDVGQAEDVCVPENPR